MKPHVLSIGDFPDATMAELAARFTLHHFHRLPRTPDDLPPGAAERIRAIATEANRGVDRMLLAMLPGVEIVSVFGVGLDLVDVAALRERGIALTNTRGLALAEEVADLALAMMLASARQIIFADRFVREGRWRAGAIPLGRSVGGKTMGVVGLGGIGRAIADRGAAFRMRVLYNGPRAKADAPYEFVPDLIELAKASDYLVVACKGAPETRHLISAAVIDALGPSGTVVNVSRGSVIDEAALIAALASGRLGHAALDVFENEPEIAPALLDLPNVIVQPHHGSATLETRTALGALMIDNISAQFAGEKLLTPVG